MMIKLGMGLIMSLFMLLNSELQYYGDVISMNEVLVCAFILESNAYVLPVLVAVPGAMRFIEEKTSLAYRECLSHL